MELLGPCFELDIGVRIVSLVSELLAGYEVDRCSNKEIGTVREL